MTVTVFNKHLGQFNNAMLLKRGAAVDSCRSGSFRLGSAGVCWRASPSSAGAAAGRYCFAREERDVLFSVGYLFVVKRAGYVVGLDFSAVVWVSRQADEDVRLTN